MDTKTVDWRYVKRMGLIAGVVALYTSAIGMVVIFSERSIIADVLNLGQIALFMITLVVAYTVGRKTVASTRVVLISGAVVGIASTVPLVVLLIVLSILYSLDIPYRTMFVNL